MSDIKRPSTNKVENALIDLVSHLSSLGVCEPLKLEKVKEELQYERVVLTPIRTTNQFDEFVHTLAVEDERYPIAFSIQTDSYVLIITADGKPIELLRNLSTGVSEVIYEFSSDDSCEVLDDSVKVLHKSYLNNKEHFASIR